MQRLALRHKTVRDADETHVVVDWLWLLLVMS
jgi:hypothetical protein